MGLLSRLAAARLPWLSDEFWLPEEEYWVTFFRHGEFFQKKLTFEHRNMTSSFVLWVLTSVPLARLEAS